MSDFQINNGFIEKKPKCDHIYGRVYFEESIDNIRYNEGILAFKCEKCNEDLRIKVDRMLFERLIRGG